MSTTTPDTPSRSGLPPSTHRLLLAVALLGALLLGVWLGRAAPAPAHWEKMDAQLYRAGEVVVFVDTSGTGRFEFESSVPTWIDGTGSYHTGGMPECLVVPGADTRPSWELTVEDVSFAWARVGSSGIRGSVVVAVDCRA